MKNIKTRQTSIPAAQYRTMSLQELREATKEYDKEFAGVPGRPLSPKMKAIHDRVTKRGRPVVGRGAQRIAVTVERDLLKQADAFARRRDISRSQLIAIGLRLAIKKSA
ncbi:MAG TPA: hypothetical protein VH475_28040 [Tepidisphaeraceae bacterium]|jgi:hypothetical protein